MGACVEGRIGVIGDLMVEFEAQLDVAFTTIESDVLFRLPLPARVGGTAGNFALSAVGLFEHVRVFGMVGSDPAGAMVQQRLAAEAVDLHLAIVSDRPTGTAVCIRDAAAALHGGVRVLIVGENAANRCLDEDYVMAHAAAIRECDVLVVDGHSLQAEPRRTACLLAMRLAREAGVTVVLDVVPHDAHRRYGLPVLQRYAADAAVLVAEVDTLRGFLRDRTTEGGDGVDIARATARAAAAVLPDRWLLLRFGIGNADESLVVSPEGVASHSRTGYAQTTDRLGFGDRLTARELAELAPAMITRADRGPA